MIKFLFNLFFIDLFYRVSSLIVKNEIFDERLNIHRKEFIFFSNRITIFSSIYAIFYAYLSTFQQILII